MSLLLNFLWCPFSKNVAQPELAFSFSNVRLTQLWELSYLHQIVSSRSMKIVFQNPRLIKIRLMLISQANCRVYQAALTHVQQEGRRHFSLYRCYLKRFHQSSVFWEVAHCFSKPYMKSEVRCHIESTLMWFQPPKLVSCGGLWRFLHACSAL